MYPLSLSFPGSTEDRSVLVTKADCCCTMGAAWGEDCELCPRRGSREFEDLCMDSGFGQMGQDIDECKTMPNLCENGQCINTLGSYRCICNRGFKPDPQVKQQILK